MGEPTIVDSLFFYSVFSARENTDEKNMKFSLHCDDNSMGGGMSKSTGSISPPPYARLPGPAANDCTPPSPSAPELQQSSFTPFDPFARDEFVMMSVATPPLSNAADGAFPASWPMPEPIPDDTDDAMEVREQAENYFAALAGHTDDVREALEDVIDAAEKSSHLAEYVTRKAKAKAALESAKAAYEEKRARWEPSEAYVHYGNSYWAGKMGDLEPQIKTVPARRELEEARQRLDYCDAVVRTLEQQTKKAIARFDQTVRSVVARSVEGLLNLPETLPDEEIHISSIILSEMAGRLRSLGETGIAQAYFTEASANATTQVDAMWYFLSAAQLVAEGNAEKAMEYVELIDTLRGKFSSLHEEIDLQGTGIALEEMLLAGPEDHLSAQIAPPIGTREQLYMVEAHAWGAQYDLLHAAMAQPELSDDDREKIAGRIDAMETERRLMLRRRIPAASQGEALIHLRNLKKVAAAITMKHGRMEWLLSTKQRADELKAHALQQELESDLADARRLSRSLPREENDAPGTPGDPVFEALADVTWQVNFEGPMARRRPREALENAAIFVQDAFEGSEVITGRLAALRQEAKELEVESFLFTPEGRVNPLMDVSHLEAGIAAASRVRSTLLISGNRTQETVVPIVSGTVCGGLVALCAPSFWGMFGAAALCGFGSSAGNTIDNFNRATQGVAYQQALMTGLTRISESEAKDSRRETWWFQADNVINASFAGSTLPLFGGVVGSALKTATASTASAYETAGLLAEILPEFSAKEIAQYVARKVTPWAKNNIGRLGRAYGGLPTGSKINLALSTLWPLDYAFIDKNYHPTIWDGQVDTALGYIGEAAFASEMIYRGFAYTWRSTPGHQGLEILLEGEEKAKTYLGFADVLEKEGMLPFLRHGAIKVGAGLTAADYFLLKQASANKIEWVDFGAPRKTPLEVSKYERQFSINTGVGQLGLAMTFADWGIHEWKSFPMFIPSAKGVLGAKIRVGSGLALIGADYLADVEQWHEGDKWYFKGLGGALLIGEAAYSMGNIDAMGSLSINGFNVVYEWLKQWMQYQRFEDPDVPRIWSAVMESLFMRMVVKSLVKGTEYNKTFPLGSHMNRLYGWMLEEKRSPVLKTFAKNLRSVQYWSGKPIMMPGEKAWAPKVVKAGYGKKIKLKYDANGRVEAGELRIASQKKWHTKQTRIYLNKKPFVVDEHDELLDVKGRVDIAAKRTLQENGFFVRDGNIHVLKPQYRGIIRKGDDIEEVTARTVRKATGDQRDGLIRKLSAEGVIYVDEAYLATKLPIEERQFIVSELERQGIRPEAYEKGILMQRRYKEPKMPRILSAHARATEEIGSFTRAKVLDIPMKKGAPIRMSAEREYNTIKSVTVGGKKIPLFTGEMDSPRLRFHGIIREAPIVMSSAALSNSLIFNKTAEGDPVYQPAGRAMLYAWSMGFIDPVIRWPLGYDSFLPQTLGKAALAPAVLVSTWLVPPYINTFSGATTLYDALDSVPNSPIKMSFEKAVAAMPWRSGRPEVEPIDIFAGSTSSSTIIPRGGSFNKYEEDALQTYQDYQMCQADVLSGARKFSESNACNALPAKTHRTIQKEMKLWEERRKNAKITPEEQLLRRNVVYAENFRRFIELERTKGLSTHHRRALILVAASMKSAVKAADESKNATLINAYKPWRDLAEEYKEILFNDIPALQGRGNWDRFIGMVNKGEFVGENFYQKLQRNWEDANHVSH